MADEIADIAAELVAEAEKHHRAKAVSYYNALRVIAEGVPSANEQDADHLHKHINALRLIAMRALSERVSN